MLDIAVAWGEQCSRSELDRGRACLQFRCEQYVVVELPGETKVVAPAPESANVAIRVLVFVRV